MKQYQTVIWVALLLAAKAFASPLAPVPVGAWWQYSACATEPPENWLLDSTSLNWPSARGGFGYATYGPFYAESVVLDSSFAAPNSACFRTSFEITNFSLIQSLLLRMDYDAGFVAWINGTEVARSGSIGGSPGEAVSFGALATEHGRGETELFDISAARSLLKAGTNILCVQVFKSESYGSLVFNAELMINFNRTPYVANVTPTNAFIACRTHLPTRLFVQYGLTPSMDQYFEETTAATNHLILVPNLQPGSLYYYQVGTMVDDDPVLLSPMASFRSFKQQGSLRFSVLGDSGSGCVQQMDVASVLERSGGDLVLHTGDIVYHLLSDGMADLRSLSIYRTHQADRPYFFTAGNHDLGGDYYAVQRNFALPTNKVSGTSHYYSFDHGDAHFVCLFVPTMNYLAALPQFNINPGYPQYNWLTNDLAATKKTWKVVFFHIPLRTSSQHTYDDYDYNGEYDSIQIRSILDPVFARYKVNLVFNGHDHTYERFYPVSNLVSIVTGGGGFNTYARYRTDLPTAVFQSIYNCVTVGITNDVMTLQAADRYGNIFDTWSWVNPYGDADGDGMLNSDETVAGTDPNNPDSLLKLEALPNQSSVTFRWQTVQGRRYVLESASDAQSTFTPLNGFPITATGEIMTWDTTVSPNAFYRSRFWRSEKGWGGIINRT